MITMTYGELLLYGFACGLLVAAIILLAVVLIRWWERRKEWARLRLAFVAEVKSGKPPVLLRAPDPVDVAQAAVREIDLSARRHRGGRR